MKVFVSSLIRGYEEYRAAARDAITVLGEVPVMAEHDFGAKPVTPREACLEGVRQSDVYVGLFGGRYGHVSEGGMSATQEEFEEARRRGLAILVFEQDVEKQEEQRDLLSAIKGYEEGYFVDVYGSPEELKDKVIRALANLRGLPSSGRRTASDAASLFEEHSDPQRLFTLAEPWIRVGTCPSMIGIEFFSRVELGRKDVKERFLHAAMFGESAVLSPELGYREVLEEDVLRYIQPAEQIRRQAASALEIHTDGLIQVARTLSRQGLGTSSMLGHFLIDEGAVYQCLLSMVNYVRVAYGASEASGRIASVFLQVRMGGLANKMLGKIPKPEPSSVTIPMHSLPEHVVVPRTPIELARRDLADAPNAAGVVSELIRRQFILAGAYYGAG